MVGRLARMAVAGAAAILLVAGCTEPGDGEGDAGATSSSATNPAPPTELSWTTGGGAICDGSEQRAGTIRDAAPGELIELSSPMPIDVAQTRADADGNSILRWTCDPSEAGLRWDLTATGVESGRTVRFTVEGEATPLPEEPVEVTLYADDLVCDGARHDVGVIDGLTPGESVAVESDQGGEQVLARADVNGTLVIGWSCRPGDVDQTWDVTVVAEDTGRTTEFSLSGVAWDGDGAMAVESAVTEVVCDGSRQVVAVLTGLFPFETVTFESPQSRGVLRDGQAEGDGRLEMYWSCARIDTGTTWEITVTATEGGETAVVSLTGLAPGPAEPASAELIEDPFVCDGQRRPVAALAGFDDGEFVDFEAPQSGPLREGRAASGELTMNWQCDPEQAGTLWEVTATGRESGRAVTVMVTGAAP